MAIDLPPVLPPALTATQDVSAYGETTAPYVRKVGDHEIKLTGNHYLNELELDTLFGRAKTPSQAILLVSAATYNKGHLLVRLLYSSPQKGVIHVHALQSNVGEIKGDALIKRHFGNLAGDHALTREEFDTERVLANLHADRVGVNYSVNYEPSETNPDIVNLVFTESDKSEHDATDLLLQIGNQGSRFAGRYFVDAGLQHNFQNGTQVSLGYETAITEWGEARDGEDYQQYQVNLDHPFSFGLYGVEARHAEYTRDLGTINLNVPVCVGPVIAGICTLTATDTTSTEVELDAEIDQFALTGAQVLSSDIDHRFNLKQRLEWTDSQIDANTGTTVQDERYAALELGANYHRAKKVSGKLLNWKVAAAVKGGITSDKGTLGTDSSTEGISIGKRTAEFITLKPSAELTYSLTDTSSIGLAFSGQIADEQLPQQQQWVLGGIDRISAYLPGVLVGDSGYHVDVSYNRRWDVGAFKVTAALFAEYGSAQFENASGAGPDNTDFGSDSSIADAGLRATVTAWDWLEVRAVIAESLSDDNVGEEILERSEADFFIVLKATF